MKHGLPRFERAPVLIASLLLAGFWTSCRQEALVGLRRDDASDAPGKPEPREAAAPRQDSGAVSVVIDECVPVNPALLDPPTTERLVNGGEDPTAVEFLYPYDGTVFPGSGPAPLLMWSGPRADFVHVRLRAKRFDYRICAVPTGDNRLQLSQAVWDAASAATGGGADPFELTLTTLGGGVPRGPARERVVVARAPSPAPSTT